MESEEIKKEIEYHDLRAKEAMEKASEFSKSYYNEAMAGRKSAHLSGTARHLYKVAARHISVAASLKFELNRSMK